MTVREDRKHGIAAAIAEAKRAGKIITPKLQASLDAHVAAAFEDAQANIGVHSGRLKASGRSGSSVRDGGDTYIGHNAWGGEGIDYEVFHLAQNPEWWRDYPAHEAAMGETIDAHMREHLR